MSDRFVVLSGCSGGGKSTLLEELGRRGHAIVPEPGRRIVQEELARGGTALPWLDLAAFARRAIALALSDRAAMRGHAGLVFFDRGLIDAASALEAAGGEPLLATLAAEHRYNRQVFLSPPWPEIYRQDAERKQTFEDCLATHEVILETYRALDYEPVLLPLTDVETRADFILAHLDGTAR